MRHIAFRIRQKIIKKSVFRFNQPVRRRARKNLRRGAKIVPSRDDIEVVFKTQEYIIYLTQRKNLGTLISRKFLVLKHEMNSQKVQPKNDHPKILFCY